MRLRYYISHRLIAKSGEADHDAWRLPAQELEAKVAHVLPQHLKAHVWFEQIKAGKTLSEIAESAGTSNHRVQQMIAQAFPAPNIVNDILAGKQPTEFTSNWYR